MAKAKTAYVCNDCGADHSKWQGQCSECGAWNTLSEIRLSSAKKGPPSRNVGFAGEAPKVLKLAEVNLESVPRISSGLSEFDRVLGGGIVPGSVTLIGGHPGAGKSTILLQTAVNLLRNHSVLYVTGEESLQQIAMRAERLGLSASELPLLAETDVEKICHQCETNKPQMLIVDSIQVMHLADVQSAPGSVSQVRECAAVLTRFAKQTNTAVLMVGHVTKEGSLAGPKVLEHMIDCSLMLEGEQDSRYRTLRSHKNRFGAVNELGVFAMTNEGMREVKNPSAIFLSGAQEKAAGTVVTATWEGTRPLLVEIQALVDPSQLGNPRRVTVGMENNRLAMLLAILHRHGQLFTSDQDVFVNVVGGVKLAETSADLAVLMAVVSSFRNAAIRNNVVILGEVGLSGEIRPVSSGQERIREAAKHGFTHAVVPTGNKPKEEIENLKVLAVNNLQQALSFLDELV